MNKRYFLEEVVDYTFSKYKKFEDLHIIFPNRRAGIYFQKALSKKIDNVIWSPKIRTFEEFVQKFSGIKISNDVSDNIVINHILFEIINKYQDKNLNLTFEKFYYWGQMLINDFEDIDQSLQKEEKIFKLVKDQKEIEETFNFLDKENFESIKSFWTKFFPNMSVNQKNFHKTWKILLKVYRELYERLKKKKLAYKGLVYKDLVNNINKKITHEKGSNYLFVGFSVLSNAEKEIIKYFIDRYSAMAFWDFDQYYYDDYKQEAGESFRQFRNDEILNSTFPKSVPNNFEEITKEFQCIGAPSQVGQTKILGNLLNELKTNKDFDEDKVLVLLPNESMLFPVLNSIPDSVKKINVSMGFPLSETPLYDLIHIILRVKKNAKKSNYQNSSYYKDIIELISHPYIYQYDKDFSDMFIEELNNKKLIYISHDYLSSKSTLFNEIFKGDDSILEKLTHIIEVIYERVENFGNLDKEYFVYFHNLFDRLIEINLKIDSIDIFSKLLSQIAKLTKIPFSGEPLSGLQIMGVYESRNLDFDQVFILSMNEGEFPKKSISGSFIPFNIKKAFGLPTDETVDSIFSYLFYRVVQRAKKVTFIYKNKSDFSSTGELSRYVKQLELESKYSIKKTFLSNNIAVNAENKISISKSNKIIDTLKTRFSEKGYFSPSAIKDYISCNLKFYYKYLANIEELKPYVDQINKMEFGKLSHKALQLLYSDIIKNKPNGIIEKNDFFKIKSSIKGSVLSAFKNYFKLKSKNELLVEGQNVILFEIIQDYISKIVSIDEKNAPFEIIDLEGDNKDGYTKQIMINSDFCVNISGFIDRIDRKDGIVRILDYKTGGDKKKVRSVEALFSEDRRQRNDAAFQLFFYSLLYSSAKGNNETIEPGIINIREMNSDNFDSRLFFNGNKKINDVRNSLDEFEEFLKETIEKIFNKEIPFKQTKDLDTCKFCCYKNICNKPLN